MISIKYRARLLAACGILLTCVSPALAAERLRALIVDGQNNH